MNIAQLEYLRVLYGEGSFSKASRKLQITQPALSLQIQKLEDELGFKLLDRSKRPIEFTSEGLFFYEKVVEILNQIDELKDISIVMSEEIEGEIKVGIIPTLAPYLVPLFVDLLNGRYPKLRLDVRELKTHEIIESLKMGNIDCGIISTPIAGRGLIFVPLFYERFYAYVSHKHNYYDRKKVSIHEIKEDEVWYLNEGNCFQNQINSICSISPKNVDKKRFVYRSDSIESLRRIVEYKSGLTFIPELATINIPAEQEDYIKEIDGDQPFREISLVATKGTAKERQLNALMEVIRDSLPSRMIKKPKEGIVDTKL